MERVVVARCGVVKYCPEAAFNNTSDDAGTLGMHPQTATRRFRLQKVEESANFRPTRRIAIRPSDGQLSTAEKCRNPGNVGGFRHRDARLMPEIDSRRIDQLSNRYQKTARIRIFNL